MFEWVLDFYFDDYGPECADCFRADFSSDKVARSGSFSTEAYRLLTSYRFRKAPSARSDGFGLRCARKP